ncbi:MAG: sensor histidine kinase [Caulobacteraceae bacterium]
MIRSIRVKLFVVFIILLAIFLFIFLMANAYFLDDIFVWGNRSIMQKAYTEFRDKQGKGYDEEELIDRLANEFGGNIVLITKDMKVITSTYSRFNKFRLTRVSSDLVGWINHNMMNVKKGEVFLIWPRGNEQDRLVAFIGRLPNGGYYIAEKSLVGIYDSSRMAERFIIVSGIGTLIIGSIMVFFLSARITKPIIRINDAAKEIANLNFSNRVKISTNDELGILAGSINLIADKLSQSLNELKDSNLKLREDIEQERKLEKMRRKFVSNVSHELKTPISMIQGYADGLKYNIAKNPEDVEYYCDVIIDESEKMSHLIKDLLDLSSYESGTFKITKEPFDIVELTREIAAKYQNVLGSSNKKIEINAPVELMINADRLRIEQIMMNLMSNAVKHVYDEGCIKITVSDLKGKALLSVYNTGSHIDAADIDNIWTSFYKTASGKDKVKDGTGLGLAIVKAITELHGGSYGVENIQDGVNFWVEIPV